MNTASKSKRNRQGTLLDAKEEQCRAERVPGRSRGPARTLGQSGAGCRSTHEPTIQPRSSDPVVTKVTARVDVGFGNQLFIRGQGNGLSWERGQPLRCLESAAWVWSAASAGEESVFKLLLNDEIWCSGENVRIRPGGQVEVVPRF